MNLSNRFQYAIQGYLADAVLLRRSYGAYFYDPRPQPAHRPRSRQAHAQRSRAAASSASTRSTATGASRCRAASCSYSESVQRPGPRARRERLPAAGVRADAVPQRHARAVQRRRSSRRRRSSASSARCPATRCGWRTRSRRRSATRCRGRRSTPTLRYYQRLSATRPARAAGARASRAGATTPDFTVLRRQLRDARLRLPGVHRPERGLRQRRAALPADRGDADADRRPRRHPRRRSSSTSAARWFDNSGFTFCDEQDRDLHAASSASTITDPMTGSLDRRSTAPPVTVSGFRLVDARASYGIGLETFVARLPDPLRLVVADAVQQGLGEPATSVTP